MPPAMIQEIPEGLAASPPARSGSDACLDGIVYDIAGGASKGGFDHPTCGGKEADVQEIGAGAIVE